MDQLSALNRLIAAFRTLPSVGTKTATSYAYSIINMKDSDVQNLIDAIQEAKDKIKFCTACGNYSEDEICERCKKADKSVICVVKDPQGIIAFEKTGAYDGLYHVLHGTLDFVKGIGEEDIRIKELLGRLDGVKEVIIATNSDVSGEQTAAYLAKLIKPFDIKVTRLAFGLPVGSEVASADEITLSQALSNRQEM
ncbi:MAG: recombination protein RecR [Clostridiales bacterium]|jgi:recombination protein RecR|nr:recombination protein RecR [Clostridiales bacterium]